MDEAFESFDTKGELALSQRAFGANPAHAQAVEVGRYGVFRPVDDTQVFGATTLERGLHQSARATRDKVQRLDDHAFATAPGQFAPPLNTSSHADGIVDLDLLIGGRQQKLRICLAESRARLHMP